MRILIAGAGRAGLHVATHLAQLGHVVIVVDRDEMVTKHAFERYGLIAFAGDATDASLLKEAEVHRADIVVVMLQRDADNLAVALLARAAGVQRVMVRMRDAEYRSVYKSAGINEILSEIDIFIGALATAIEHTEVQHAMILGGGQSIAFELHIPEDAAIVGTMISDIAADPDFPASCVFAGMFESGGEVQAPRGFSVVKGGMTVLLVSRCSDIGNIVSFFLRRSPSRLS
ncbi:potassium channel family protein [Pajaroellobacter abortibovis]|uniref:TrkA family potassium uptake protein n=1 Tax=Pajaroellobacter abortibovis TaxID=1882918 RepID=A0A1L6MZ93_9BACT|nr:TrkA family potassium uptake protein [Pajaroellobacter abortibovis]APS00758.1 TrkA family potassium uptake protein [Pajaroellobacter abortibovis]